MKTSVHFCPVKPGSEGHNKRKKYLQHVDPARKGDNRYFETDTQAHRLDTLRKLVKEKTGRAMQKKCTPILEGVLPIAPDTTMEELVDFANAARERWGIDCFQIAIHRDEGKMSKLGKVMKVNHHAHMVFDWIDHATGKTIKIGRAGMCEMQTLAANCLHMERGKSSDRKHLSAVQYKVWAHEEELNRLHGEAVKATEVAAAAKAEKKRLDGINASNTAVIKKQVADYNSRKDEIKAIEGSLRAAEGKIRQANEIDLEGLKSREKELRERLDKTFFAERARRWPDLDEKSGELRNMWQGLVRLLFEMHEEVRRAVAAIYRYATHSRLRPGDDIKADEQINRGIAIASANGSDTAKRMAADVLLDIAEELGKGQRAEFVRCWGESAIENAISNPQNDQRQSQQQRGWRR